MNPPRLSPAAQLAARLAADALAHARPELARGLHVAVSLGPAIAGLAEAAVGAIRALGDDDRGNPPEAPTGPPGPVACRPPAPYGWPDQDEHQEPDAGTVELLDGEGKVLHRWRST